MPSLVALTNADTHPFRDPPVAVLAQNLALTDGVIRLSWEVDLSDFCAGSALSSCFVIAQCERAPAAIVSRRFFERLEALAPGTVDTVPVEHPSGSLVGLFPRVIVAGRSADSSVAGELQTGRFAVNPAAATAPLFLLQVNSKSVLVVSEQVARDLEKDGWLHVRATPFVPTPAHGGRARPELFGATVVAENNRLIVFARSRPWERRDGQWKALERQPVHSALAYVDPQRGVVLVVHREGSLARVTWGGEEIDRRQLPGIETSACEVCFDPLNRRLVVSNAVSGAPWTLTLDDGGNVLMHDVPLTSMAFDAGRGRMIGLRTVFDSEPGVPELGVVAMGEYSPLLEVGVSAASEVCYDDARAAVVLFAQPERGESAVMYALQGSECARVEPTIEAPPSRHGFRLASQSDRLFAFGGQAFDDSDPDSIWVLQGTSWRELR